MQAKSKIDVIPGQLSYSLSGALSELSGVWTGELEALQQELESDIRKYSEGLGETVQHIQKTAQGLKEMDMVMNAILMPSNIVLHSLSKFGFDVTSKRFISYQGRITPATGQLMARYKKGELYSYDRLFPKSKNVKVKAKNNYEAEILEAVKNHKVPSPDALRSGMGLAQDENIKDPMERQFIDTNLTNGQVASLVADFVPFLGGIKAADEARTGKQHFTGAKLDATDRTIAAASVLGGGFVKWTGKGAKAVLKGKPLSEQTHLKWNKKTGEVKKHTPKKSEKTETSKKNKRKRRTSQPNFVGKEVTLDWLGAGYKAVEIQGTVKVGGVERDISRRVYQNVDIDWDYVPQTPKANGMSNRELVANRQAPFAIDKYGNESKVVLHHLIQKEAGNMVELIATTHSELDGILHGIIDHGNSFRKDPVLDKQYTNFRNNYWKWRSQNLD
ncbi:HNH/ENDO VII family nuclease [Priestia filamentosa]|uniref:HNH/ENDO VII family nuclease n=1 Tax=Priestia filamentosa TaxID=1402861 RepID=UPI003857ADA4